MEKIDPTFLIQLLNNKATASVVVTTQTSSRFTTKILNEVGFEYNWEETTAQNFLAATSKCKVKLKPATSNTTLNGKMAFARRPVDVNSSLKKNKEN